MAEVYQIPENGGNSGIPFSIPLGGNGFGGFGGGMNGIVDLFGLAIIASIFGWGNGGFGGGFGGGSFGGGGGGFSGGSFGGGSFGGGGATSRW